MHYFATVLIEECPHDEAGIKAAVEKVMAPHEERWEPSPGCDPDDEDDDGIHSGHWDWWTIGGRYTGRWSEYEPASDPRNWEVCFLCHGTGMRTDERAREWRKENPDYTCNGCGIVEGSENQRFGIPRGMSLKFAANWVRNEFDIIPVKKLLVLPVNPSYAIVTPDGFLARENWDGSTFHPVDSWPKVYLSKLREFPDHTAVIVDYHN